MATVPGDRLESLSRRWNTALEKLEDATLEVVDAGLIYAARSLESDLGRLYRRAAEEVRDVPRGSPLREARARLLLEQLTAILSLRAGRYGPDLERLAREAFGLGGEEALETLGLYERDLVRATTALPLEVLAAAGNAAKRLEGHGEDFSKRVGAIVVSGLATGKGYSAVGQAIRREVGVTRGRAEGIARTLSAEASSTARERSYEANGVTHYAWLAVQGDSRLCKFCASRAGAEWPLGKGPRPPAHPRCRCVTTVSGPKYRDLDLIDLEFARRHSAEAMRNAGIERRTFAPSDYEKRAGVSFGRPTWTP